LSGRWQDGEIGQWEDLAGKLMSIKVIIFDFDGTLADTLDAVVRITNRLAIEFGYKPTAPEELAKIRNLSSREIINQSGISLFKIPFLLNKLKIALRNEIQYLKKLPSRS
jgi:beta-phosphoglucomutase-like phosphatase (HAD superfamily)